MRPIQLAGRPKVNGGREELVDYYSNSIGFQAEIGVKVSERGIYWISKFSDKMNLRTGRVLFILGLRLARAIKSVGRAFFPKGASTKDAFLRTIIASPRTILQRLRPRSCKENGSWLARARIMKYQNQGLPITFLPELEFLEFLALPSRENK